MVWEEGGNIQRKNLGVNLSSSFALGPKSNLLDAVLDAVLLLAGYVHYVEGQEFAGYLGEGDVEVDFHSFACCNPSWSASVFLSVFFVPLSCSWAVEYAHLVPYQPPTRGVLPPSCSLSILPTRGTRRRAARRW